MGNYFGGGGTDGHHDGDPALPGEGVEADDGADRVAQDGVEEPQVVAGQHRQPQGHQHQIKILLPNHCLDPLSAPSPRNLSVSSELESERDTFVPGSTNTATKERKEATSPGRGHERSDSPANRGHASL